MTDRFDGLPEIIRVGPFDLDILRRDSLDEDGSWGIYNHGISIELQSAQPSEVFAVDTLLHELGHAIYKIYGMAGDEEHTVIAMAGGWTQVFRDNPELLAWIALRLK